jgi:hypothetical protein
MPKPQDAAAEMAANPLVTIVIPCFNAARTVAAALASARAQTYRPIEIVAIDDCSTDDTLKILQADGGSDLVVIAGERNRGAASARNRAIMEATGEYLAFLDADDSWAPEKLTCQLALLATDPAMAMVGCRAEVVWLDGKRATVNADRVPPQGQDAWRDLLHHAYYVTSEIVTRTEIARLIGGFKDGMSTGEDQDFFIRLALEGSVGFVDAPLVTMHQQPGSLSIRQSTREASIILPMIEGHCRTLSDRLSPSERHRILGARYTALGRGLYPAVPGAGARLLVRAILNGTERLGNLRYLMVASPWARRLKARRAQAARSDTFART